MLNADNVSLLMMCRNKFNEIEYEVLGVIEYEPLKEHFIAHVQRASNSWNTYDNLIGRQFECDKEKKIIINMIFYRKTEIGKII